MSNLECALIATNGIFVVALFLCIVVMIKSLKFGAEFARKVAVQKEIYDILADKLDNKDKIIKAQYAEIEKLKNALRGDTNG